MSTCVTIGYAYWYHRRKNSDFAGHHLTKQAATGNIMAKATLNKPYHHGDLRQSLIDAACKHLRESGADTLSLRALAREVGVSQTAPYRHFESKGALFAAIPLYGFELLRDEMSAVSGNHPNEPDKLLVEMGHAYLGFALKHPEKYQMFFDSSLVDFAQDEGLMNAGSEAFAVLTGAIQLGIDAGVFVEGPATEAAGVIWASMHGMASLMLTKEPMLRESHDHGASQAMLYLAENPQTILERFVNSIRRTD